MTASQKSSQRGKLMGVQQPTERVVPDYEKTDGFDARKILYAGGFDLDPWQTDVLNDWMAVRGGAWVCRTCGGSVARQNGKTGLIWARASAGMLLYGEKVLYTAHLQKTSTETFEEMAGFFDSTKLRKYVEDIKTAIGREQIILNNGARVKFLARTRNGGRGQHGDLLIFDEAQELEFSSQASFIPAISASKNPQVIYTGTPPDDDNIGVVFRGIRDKALNGKTKTTAWFEFSVDEIGDVTDRERWALTNPALGRRILETTIEGELEQMPPETFARERLGRWSPVVERNTDYAIDSDAWAECASDELKPEGKTAYGIKFAADGTLVCLCGAVIGADGKTRVSLIDIKPTGLGVRWLADWLNERYTKAACVVIDGRNGVDVLINEIVDTWKAKGSVIKPTSKEVIAAVGMLTNAVNERSLTWYRKQEILNESATTSVKRPFSGGWGFGGENAIPIEACALALYGVNTSKRDPSKKMRIG